MISTLEAKRLPHKGCEAYLAHVINTSTPKMTLENVPIVQEFLNVFPEDFPWLPPNRELKFCIDLLPKTTLISIQPYRMALAELKELKSSCKIWLIRVSSDQVYHLEVLRCCL